MQRYLDQAADYEGQPVRFAEHWDQYNEHHVIIEMQSGSEVYWLDWIGGEYAPEPDEFDSVPFENLCWRKI